jgi:hypothetical protein
LYALRAEKKDIFLKINDILIFPFIIFFHDLKWLHSPANS